MNQSSVPIQDISSFVAVATNASFTRAAEQLGTSKSNVGKAVQRLEARLGTRLLQRTTRAVRLTEDGQTYLDAAQAALNGLGEAELALASRRDQPSGRVRLEIPAGFGGVLIPTLKAIRRKHPLVTIELLLSDRQVDAVADGLDIVVRVGDLPLEGGMTVRKLCDVRLGLYASEAYLRQHQPIDCPEALSEQDGVVFRGTSGRLRPWTIFDGQSTREIIPATGLIVSDGRAMLDATRNGLGISQIFDLVAFSHVRSGELQKVLPSADVSGPPVHALIPLGRRMPPKTRVVLEHLAAVLRSATL